MKALYLLIVASASVAALCAFTLTAGACDAYSFSACAVYAPVQAYVAPVQQYVAPQVSYYQAPQQVILPQKVAIVRPEYRLEVQQAYGYQPVVQKFVQPYYAQQLRVQKFVQPYSQAVVVQKQFAVKQFNSNAVVSARRGLFGSTVVREADGDVKRFNAFGRRVR